jgi:hypothetical protein
MIFDMFVRGIPGRKHPYAIKLLTKMQLSEILIKIGNSKKIKGLVLILLSDAPIE